MLSSHSSSKAGNLPELEEPEFDQAAAPTIHLANYLQYAPSFLLRGLGAEFLTLVLAAVLAIMLLQ